MPVNTARWLNSYSWTYDEVTPFFIKWTTSQAYNNDDVLLFLLQIWKQPHRIKRSDQFRVNEQYTNCFEHLHEENTKPLVSVAVSYAWIFLSNSGFLWFLRGEGRIDGTLIWIEGGMVMFFWLFPPPHFGREEFPKRIRPWKQQSRGDMKNNRHEEWNLKCFRSSYTIFGK